MSAATNTIDWKSTQESSLKALTKDATDAVAWSNLGASLDDPDKVVCVGEDKYTKRECFIKAVTFKPEFADAWVNLGSSLAPGEEITIGDAGKLTAKGCYIKALEINGTVAQGWCRLAMAMDQVGIVTISDVKFTKKECLINAVQMDPKYYVAWFKLGNTLNPDGETVNVGAEKLTAKQCYIKALELIETVSNIWYNLAASMSQGEELTIRGSKYQQHHCLVKVQSLEMDVKDAEAWVTMGSMLVMKDQVTTIGGDTFTQKQCYEMALKIDPKNAAALSFVKK